MVAGLPVGPAGNGQGRITDVTGKRKLSVRHDLAPDERDIKPFSVPRSQQRKYESITAPVCTPSLHRRGKHLFHGKPIAASLLISSTVRPEGVRNPREGGQTGIVARLVPVVDGCAWKYAIAVMLVRADGRYSSVGMPPIHSAIG